MRKLVVTELLSLGGVAEAPDSFFGWDEAVDAKIPELIATQDAVMQWANTTVIDGGSAIVRDLKHQPGGDIGVHGSISVAQALLAADIVDELTLAIAPTIAGRGRRLLEACHRFSSHRSEARSHRLAT